MSDDDKKATTPRTVTPRTAERTAPTTAKQRREAAKAEAATKKVDTADDADADDVKAQAKADEKAAADKKVQTAAEQKARADKEGNTTGQIDDPEHGEEPEITAVEPIDATVSTAPTGVQLTGLGAPTWIEPVPQRSSMEPGVKTNSGKVLPPRKPYTIIRADTFVSKQDSESGETERKNVGEVVWLTIEEAKDLQEKGVLGPYIDGDGDVDVTDGIDNEYDTNAVSEDDKNKV